MGIVDILSPSPFFHQDLVRNFRSSGARLVVRQDVFYQQLGDPLTPEPIEEDDNQLVSQPSVFTTLINLLIVRKIQYISAYSWKNTIYLLVVGKIQYNISADS